MVKVDAAGDVVLVQRYLRGLAGFEAVWKEGDDEHGGQVLALLEVVFSVLCMSMVVGS